MSDNQLVCEYRYTNPTGKHPTHMWSVVGPLGGLHLAIRPDTFALERGRHPDDCWCGGLEAHTPAPAGEHADHETCWLIGGRCRHDGTSLYVTESLAPYWRDDPHNHDRMFNRMRHEYARRFTE